MRRRCCEIETKECCRPRREECCEPRRDCCETKGRGCKPTLPMLVILILILLQFGNGRFNGSVGPENLGGLGGFGGCDNGILFIIALFYLSCCMKCGEESFF